MDVVYTVSYLLLWYVLLQAVQGTMPYSGYYLSMHSLVLMVCFDVLSPCNVDTCSAEFPFMLKMQTKNASLPLFWA